MWKAVRSLCTLRAPPVAASQCVRPTHHLGFITSHPNTLELNKNFLATTNTMGRLRKGREWTSSLEQLFGLTGKLPPDVNRVVHTCRLKKFQLYQFLKFPIAHGTGNGYGIQRLTASRGLQELAAVVRNAIQPNSQSIFEIFRGDL